jgi:uncharacterized Ntn-hydrolase superfamily protein
MTFSIVAVDKATGEFGSAVASCSVAVGGTVSYSRTGVGAINTQHQAHLAIGMRVLNEMDDGAPPQKALDTVLGTHVDAEVRQFVAVDTKSRQGAWTGRNCKPERHHLFGADCVAAGNHLASEDVIELMVEAFERSSVEILEERLLKALLAGAQAAGDKRGHKAAAISVVPGIDVSGTDVPGTSGRGPDADIAINLDLRVDDHPDPFNEIVRLHRAFRQEFPR